MNRRRREADAEAEVVRIRKLVIAPVKNRILRDMDDGRISMAHGEEILATLNAWETQGALPLEIGPAELAAADDEFKRRHCSKCLKQCHECNVLLR
jgi:hypothetical protein